MSSLYPQMSTGAVTQLTFATSPAFLTRVAIQDDYAESVFACYPNPFGSWTINLDQVSDADANVLAAFFAAQFGRYGRFIFADPLRNLLLWSEDYTQSVWTRTAIASVTLGQSDPFSGANAAAVTSSGSGSPALSQSIAIGGSMVQAGSPVWITASVWLKGTGSVTLQVSDGISIVGQRSIGLPSVWTRYHVSANFAGSVATTTLFNLALAVSETAYVFGAQLSYTPGPNTYDRTTTRCGLHPVCRFDSDMIQRIYTGPGCSRVKIPIVEIAG